MLEKNLPAIERYLSYRERCTREVERYIDERLDCSPGDKDELLTYLLEMDLLNDSRFCENRIHHRIINGYGIFYIRRELGFLKIASQTIKDCLDEIDDDQFALGSQKKALSKYKTLKTKWEPGLLKQKLVQYLYGRGHPHQIAEKIYSLMMENLNLDFP